ncbi:MAG TPA: hypothetical protein PLS66_07780 [Tepiditoga sp.]|nr:hypothetical protein [Tepiditoga sp.]
MVNFILTLSLLSLLIIFYRFITSKDSWEKLLAYSSISQKSVLIMLLYIFISGQFFLLEIIIIILNIMGILITVKFMEKRGNKNDS